MKKDIAESRREGEHTFQNGRSPSTGPQRDISLCHLRSEVGRQWSIFVLVLGEAFHLLSLGITDGGIEHCLISFCAVYGGNGHT
jgi:hypothetical protein